MDKEVEVLDAASIQSDFDKRVNDLIQSLIPSVSRNEEYISIRFNKSFQQPMSRIAILLDMVCVPYSVIIEPPNNVYASKTIRIKNGSEKLEEYLKRFIQNGYKINLE